MTPKQAIKHFGSQTALAAQLKITQPAVANWFRRGAVPPFQQLAIQAASDGVLKADRKVLAKVSRK